MQMFKVFDSGQLRICQRCCGEVNAVYEFRNRCISGLNSYKDYLNVGNKKEITSVCGSDDFKNSSLESQVLHGTEENVLAQNSDDNVRTQASDRHSENMTFSGSFDSAQNSCIDDKMEIVHIKQEQISDTDTHQDMEGNCF